MDSDGQPSEEEEARLYAMLYYVDSNNSKSMDQRDALTVRQNDQSENNSQQETTSTYASRPKTPPNLNDSSLNIKDDSKDKQATLGESKVETNIQTPRVASSLGSNNPNSGNAEQEIILSNDKNKRRVSHSRRYWASAEYPSDVNTMYVRVHSNNFVKRSNKFDNTIITLLNTRGSGKRKSSEGSSFPEDNIVGNNSEIDHSKVTPAKQSKPTFATPSNSTNNSKKGSKTKRMTRSSMFGNVEITFNNSDTSTPSRKVDKKQPKNKPLAEKLMNKFLSGNKRLKKNPFASKNTETSIVIESSDDDDDSVIEVELPDPRHATIELDSSDESQAEKEDCENNKQDKEKTMSRSTQSQSETQELRRNATSPVPSIVSSTSDDFIQADCSTLNITSDVNNGPVFNFRLHGADFCDAQLETEVKDTSTQIHKSVTKSVEEPKKQQTVVTSTTRLLDIDSECNLFSAPDNIQNVTQPFATPTSKSKKKSESKNKSYSVPEESYVLPSADIFESESSDIPESVVEVPIASRKKRRKSASKEDSVDSTTDDAHIVDLDYTSLINNPIMANVVGMEELNTANEEFDISKSSDVSNSRTQKKNKSIQKEDFENNMDKFYNTVYDKNFDHNKIRNQMPRDKSLWKIDSADRGKSRKSLVMCGYCNRAGHRSETCYHKPQICSMCGVTGHRNTRCPNKICLNCGNPSNSFSVDCNICKSWKNIYCGTCRVHGHPANRCPDLWRRYHLTTKNEVPLVECRKRKPKNLQFCSGCAKRGHIINECKNYIKFSNFAPASPYIFHYTPIYTPDAVRNPSPEDTVQIVDDYKSKSQSKESEGKSKSQVKEFDSKSKNKAKESDIKQRNQAKEPDSKIKHQGKEIDKVKTQFKEPDTKTKNQVRESDSKAKNQSKQTDKIKNQEKVFGNVTRESDRPKTPHKELENKAKIPIKEIDTKVKPQNKEIDIKAKPQIKEADNKTKIQVKETSTISQSNGDNTVSSSVDSSKHLMITVSSRVSSDNGGNVVREVRVVENASYNSPNRKIEPKPVEHNAENREKNQESFNEADSSNNDLKNTNNESTHNTKKNNNNVISKIKELDNADSSLILLSNHHGQILMSQAGGEFLNKLVQTYNVMVNITTHSDGATLTLSGNVDKHVELQRDLQLHLNVGDKVLDHTPRHLIPKERIKALSKLRLEMELLNTDLGNPKSIFTSIEKIKIRMKKRRLVNKPDKKEFKKLCREINKGYRFLNMILIGQAKLQDGNAAYNKMDSMLKYLESQNFTAMSDQIRDEIGEYYSLIFSPNPRLDYPELLDRYDKKNSGNLKTSQTIQHLLSKTKHSMTKQELILLVRKTTEAYIKFNNNPVVFGDKRYEHALKSLLAMGPKLKKKNLAQSEILKSRKTVVQYDNYINFCKKRVKKINKM